MREIITICKKELKDTLRDRRTLMSMILIPIILMPLLIVGMTKLVEFQIKKSGEQVVKIAIIGAENSPIFTEIVKKQEKLEVADFNEIRNKEDAKKAVESEQLDGALIIPGGFERDVENLKPVQVEVMGKSTLEKYGNVLAKINSASEIFNDQMLKDRFGKKNISQNILSKVSVLTEDIASEKERGGFGLGFLLPFFIVIWAITGGQYTAVDVSAGEKERKTLEPLLLAPIRRIDIVLGKFLAVSIVSSVSVAIALGSLYATILYAGFGPFKGNGVSPSGLSPVDFSIDPTVIILLFLISALLISLFSSIILSIAIFAKSFKEAQSYIGPLYMIVLLPMAALNVMIGMKPALWLFAVPAANAFLLFKEALMGQYSAAHILLTVSSLVIFSIAALYGASKVYSRESVLFKD